MMFKHIHHLKASIEAEKCFLPSATKTFSNRKEKFKNYANICLKKSNNPFDLNKSRETAAVLAENSLKIIRQN